MKVYSSLAAKFVLAVMIISAPTARATDAQPPPPPVVSIAATQPTTSEPGPTARFAPGKFTVTRTGSLNAALPVYLRYDGTATAGGDYTTLPTEVEIAVGQSSAEVLVEALADSIVENVETVIAKISEPPTSPDSIPYNISVEHPSATVTISDAAPIVPVISIEATQASTSEPLPNALVAPGVFTLRRTAPLDTAFSVWVSFGGTATSGVDFEAPSIPIFFAAGQTEVSMKIIAKSDDLLEGDETVVAELIQPPTAGPVLHYNINPDKRRAVVTIKDEDKPVQARIDITSPEDGATLPLGSTIIVKATAIDPNGYIPRVEFYSDDALIGVSEINFLVAPEPGTPIYHQIEWQDAPHGEHKVTARGVTSNGAEVVSSAIMVYVVVVDPPPLPMVSVRTVADPTLRPIPNADYASDFFEFRRNGMTNYDLQVFFDVPQDGEHLATPDVDYKALKSPITIPAGQYAAYLRVEAIDDTLVEGPEIVRVKLGPTPVMVNGVPVVMYEIDPEHSSADVTILDNDQPPEQVVISVEVADGIASEVTTTGAFDTARFVIRRVSGPTDIPVTVDFSLTGTAQNGVDYKQVSTSVEIPAGLNQVGVQIVPIPDNVEEGEETVILTLLAPPCVAIYPPPPGCYLVGQPSAGKAVILDRRDDRPGVKILQPINGAVFALGQTIRIEAQAWDREGIISLLEIQWDGEKLDSTTDDHLVVEWSQGDIGQHTIVAHAVDGSGQEAKAEIHVLIREQNAEAFVFRNLPDAYSPGTAFMVELRAEPPVGSRAYAIEDRPPGGWQVSEISNDGFFDSATGKVKFGPFNDTTARTLKYRVTPPASATGRYEFAGLGSIDGVNYRIGGDRIIEQNQTQHPADTNKDFSIAVAELTAYIAAWKGGADIPLSYVTRAGYLWKHGEAYQFDGSHEAPFCWIPLETTAPALAADGSIDGCVRIGAGETQPGVSGDFQLQITPPPGTSAYAVQERVPAGWTVKNISDEGAFDATSGLIRWGVFFDATPRALSYTLTPPPAVTAIARMEGRVSFDGVVKEIDGAGKMVSTDDMVRPTLGKCEANASGNVHLELSGPAGQVGVLQSSSDLAHWQDVATLFLPDGNVAFDDDSAAAGVRYYRLQIR